LEYISATRSCTKQFCALYSFILYGSNKTVSKEFEGLCGKRRGKVDSPAVCRLHHAYKSPARGRGSKGNMLLVQEFFGKWLSKHWIWSHFKPNVYTRWTVRSNFNRTSLISKWLIKDYILFVKGQIGAKKCLKHSYSIFHI